MSDPVIKLQDLLPQCEQAVADRYQRELLWSLRPELAPRWWHKKQQARWDAEKRAGDWARSYRP